MVDSNSPKPESAGVAKGVYVGRWELGVGRRRGNCGDKRVVDDGRSVHCLYCLLGRSIFCKLSARRPLR